MSQKCRWCDRKVIFRAGGKVEREVIIGRQVGPFLPLQVLLEQHDYGRLGQTLAELVA